MLQPIRRVFGVLVVRRSHIINRKSFLNGINNHMRQETRWARGMIWGIVSVMAATTTTASPRETFQDGFSSGNASDYLSRGGDTVEFAAGVGGGNALKFPREASRGIIETWPTPVVGRARYRLSFGCAVEGPHTFENHPQLESLLLMSGEDRKKVGRVELPYWRVNFQDENGNRVRRGHHQFFTCMLFAKRVRYVEEFVAPPGAKTLTVTFGNGETETTLVIDDLKLEKLEAGESLNVNGDFHLGRYNYSGWNTNCQYACRIRENPEKSGTFQFDASRGQAKSDPIHLEPGQKIMMQYRFHSPPGGKARLRVYFWGEDRKVKLLRPYIDVAGVSRGKGIEGVTTVSPPPGAVTMTISLSGGVYDYVKTVKFNPEVENSRTYFEER